MIEYKDQNYWNNELFKASLTNDLDLAKTAILHGADVNAKMNDGSTALMWATYLGHHGILKFLLQHPDVDVNVKSDAGWTLLMFATYLGQPAIVKFLLQHPDIDVNAKDENGWTALKLAKLYKRHEIIELLKEAGAV